MSDDSKLLKFLDNFAHTEHKPDGRVSDVADIADLLKRTRKSQGLTQADLASATGVGLRFISDIENGKETAQIGKVLHIMHALGIKMELK